jgi:hypothetical protein
LRKVSESTGLVREQASRIPLLEVLTEEDGRDLRMLVADSENPGRLTVDI